MKFIAIFLIVSYISRLTFAQGGSGNNGPIFENHPNTLNQNLVWAQFPMIESWVLGEWRLNYIYQESQNYNFTCGKLYVAQLVEGEAGLLMVATHKADNGDTIERLITGERYTKLIPGKYYVDSVTDGLIADSQDPYRWTMWGNQVLTLLSLTNNGPMEEQRYQALIYAVHCQSHNGETWPFGIPSILEVGILSRNNTIQPYIQDHLFSVFDNLMPGNWTTLRQVSC